ncbi:hypothetical protein E2C01_085953 [Portunus trituberculatus]|uniref:Uncharacterized protein n=1 Tax=Portunus trituberculatus TaxID=210409 RepID=A0A5B7J807_PORTR|nr:hypothetical protein [Portunus trituberculatus]
MARKQYRRRGSSSDPLLLAGSCDFYTSRESFMPFLYCMIGPKHSPLVQSVSKRCCREVVRIRVTCSCTHSLLINNSVNLTSSETQGRECDILLDFRPITGYHNLYRVTFPPWSSFVEVAASSRVMRKLA